MVFLPSQTPRLLQFHSEDDPFIPMAEATHVAENIGSDFEQYLNKSHFFTADEAGCVLQRILEKTRGLLDDDGDSDDGGDYNGNDQGAGREGADEGASVDAAGGSETADVEGQANM